MNEGKMNANYAKDLLLEIAKEFNCDVIYLFANLLAVKKQLQQAKQQLEIKDKQLEQANNGLRVKTLMIKCAINEIDAYNSSEHGEGINRIEKYGKYEQQALEALKEGGR